MDLLEIVNRAVRGYARGSIYTALPAKVESVGEFEGMCCVDALPLVARRYEDGRVTESPLLYRVPVVFPSAGGGALTFPVKTGDIVLLVFSMRSLEELLATDGSEKVVPHTARSHNIADAVAIPGFGTFVSNVRPHPENVELKFADAVLAIDPEGTVTIETGSAEMELRASGLQVFKNSNGSIQLGANGVVTINGAAVDVDGGITSPKEMVAPSMVVDGKELKDHTHSGVQTGGGNTGPNN